MEAELEYCEQLTVRKSRDLVSEIFTREDLLYDLITLVKSELVQYGLF